MASWTNPTTFSTGNTLTVTAWNALANDATFLYQAPYCNYYNSVAVTVPNTTFTQITLGGTTTSGYGFSVSSNNIVVPIAGIYSVQFAVVSAVAATGITLCYAYHNGGQLATGSYALNNSTYGAASTGSTIVSCSASDTLALWCFQSSGGSLNVVPEAVATFMTAAFIGSQ